METIIVDTKKTSRPFKIYQVLIPIALGLFVIGWLFLDEFDPDVFASFHFTVASGLFILLAFVFMLMRDFGMMWRFRLFTDKDLSWHQCRQKHHHHVCKLISGRIIFSGRLSCRFPFYSNIRAFQFLLNNSINLCGGVFGTLFFTSYLDSNFIYRHFQASKLDKTHAANTLPASIFASLVRKC